MRRRQPLLQTVWTCQPCRRLARLISTDELTAEECSIQQTLVHKLVRASTTIDIRQRSVEVRSRRRANKPFLLAADCAQMRPAIP